MFILKNNEIVNRKYFKRLDHKIVLFEMVSGSVIQGGFLFNINANEFILQDF